MISRQLGKEHFFAAQYSKDRQFKLLDFIPWFLDIGPLERER
jgi:hypothetical protein